MPLIALADAATALLSLVEAAAAAEHIDLPARRYVTASVPTQEPWDCEQVTVGLLQLNPANSAGGNPSEWASGSGRDGLTLPEAYLRVEIVRAVPGMDRDGEVAVQDEHQRGLAAMRDAALLHAVRGRVLTDAAITGGHGADVRLGPVVPNGAAGGYASMTLVIGATLIRTAP
jgi:hypothetical protein